MAILNGKSKLESLMECLYDTNLGRLCIALNLNWICPNISLNRDLIIISLVWFERFDFKIG